VAQLTHEGKHYFLGRFLNELEAAQTVNSKCAELNIPLKNPEVGLFENNPQVRFIEFKTQCIKLNVAKFDVFVFPYLEKRLNKYTRLKNLRREIETKKYAQKVDFFLGGKTPFLQKNRVVS
jgi:hypothetical protein